MTLARGDLPGGIVGACMDDEVAPLTSRRSTGGDRSLVFVTGKDTFLPGLDLDSFQRGLSEVSLPQLGTRPFRYLVRAHSYTVEVTARKRPAEAEQRLTDEIHGLTASTEAGDNSSSAVA